MTNCVVIGGKFEFPAYALTGQAQYLDEGARSRSFDEHVESSEFVQEHGARGRGRRGREAIGGQASCAGSCLGGSFQLISN